ncbi:condensin complex subunit 2 [Sporothrix schenckii 1099-18]|uniref:Condensin complex subunit 2 n=1 Tax=Sporothrix schenckii 1099-18 TaxID=1397361 RepID=A0A0F2MK21_SPOSC|nr:condensin complex subunit 2 [Sporothrix schenckii 1099-18]KJR89429.1 condensin complex subunit 2 [Sporothrix schenckii 1099-18]
MPRVAQAPRANSTRSNSRSASGSLSQSPFKNSPVKYVAALGEMERTRKGNKLTDRIPLNDDAQEKAARQQSRQALHEAQINQLKAAATPTTRKVSNIRLDDLENASPSSSGSPRTPLGDRAPRGRKRQSLGAGGINSRDAVAAAAAASGNRAILGGRAGDDDDEDDDRVVVGGAVVTPMKRVPILANFEEWMKMATDNKINATNSWNFALIDYFHDMSLLKEGDGVNFQKASCTLDGCVKIYTSRVDSVATETGKLLSGLADSRESKKKGGAGAGDGEESEDEDELDEDGNPKKKPKKKQRSEATLAPSFASLQLKKLELEFAVDPLFKKASADFDEGGAKGLLLNHLMIDGQGRIVFDSSDDANDIAKTRKKDGKKGKKQSEEGEEEEGEEADDDDVDEDNMEAEPDSFIEEDGDDQDVPIDVASLGHRFFPELHRLEELDVCPSLKTFDLGNPSGSLDIPFLRGPENNGEDNADGDKSAMFIDEDNPLGFDDTDALGGFDLGADVNFGEGGEAWAREARLEPQMRVYNADGDVGDDLLLLGGTGGNGAETDDFTIAMAHSSQQPDKLHDNILSYFDQALRKNWVSAEHWRIRKIKDVNKPASAAKPRKEKEPFAIDFEAPLDNVMAELLYTQASSNTAITLPKKDWKAKSRNLLPDDKHFHSKQLLSLFLKPRARLSRRRMQFGGFGAGSLFSQLQQQQQPDVPEGEMNEAFWASQKDPLRPTVEDGANGGSDGEPHGDYDANFFADDGLPFAGGDDDDDMDGEEFADAREHFSPVDGAGLGGGMDAGMTQGFTQGLGFTQGFTTGFGGLTVTNPADLAFGTTLVTSSRRVRPEYVQYARVAKRVDVRRLKEELWKGMSFDKGVAASRLLTPPPADAGTASIDEQLAASEETPAQSEEDKMLKFTDVMNGLQSVYSKSMMDDISTSYCFISLLHLANEKGLQINKTESLTDLDIRKDWTAEITAE